jgi:hypothetical protein
MTDWPAGGVAWLAINPQKGWFFPRAARRRDDALSDARVAA